MQQHIVQQAHRSLLALNAPQALQLCRRLIAQHQSGQRGDGKFHMMLGRRSAQPTDTVRILLKKSGAIEG